MASLSSKVSAPPTELGAMCKLAEGPLNPTVYVRDKEVK